MIFEIAVNSVASLTRRSTRTLRDKAAQRRLPPL